MKQLFIIAFFFGFTLKAQAALCLCQYPTENSKYGSGYKEEVSLYKLGCKFWLLTQKNCHSRKTINIEDSLQSLAKRSNEVIKLGFVGHWSGTIETVKFLDNRIEPLIMQTGVSIEIDNTACSPMENPELVLKTIKNYSLGSAYLKVKGSQATSIGMWDKLTPLLASADVYAVADSRREQVMYPSCSQHINMPCYKDQTNEKALCISNGKLKTISCKRTKLSSHLLFWRSI